MKEKSHYSVEGNYKVGNKVVFEERKYFEASSDEEALKMAREDGNVGAGMVFFNLGNSEECMLGKGGFISREKLALIISSKN